MVRLRDGGHVCAVSDGGDREPSAVRAEIFERLNPSVTIEGPVLEKEGFEIHQGFWPEFLEKS